MRVATVKLKSLSPLSQNRHYLREFPKLDKESANDYEARTWRNRLHCRENGEVIVPAMALKNMLSDCAKYISMSVPGKGKATYSKNIDAGVLVMDDMGLGVSGKEVPGEWVFVPADGRAGSGKRVEKCFPVVKEWTGEAKFYVMDETITPPVFEKHLEEAGKFIGLGRFRPRNKGLYGRFTVESIKWSEQ